MTKAEYKDIRNTFVEAQRAIELACSVFYDLAMDHGIDIGPREDDVFRPSIAVQMEDAGLWIGKELSTLENAQDVLYTLIGKAQVRTK